MFTFPKQEHLCSKELINETLSKGCVIFIHPFKLYYLASSIKTSQTRLQFAVSVPKRQFKKAVDRNRIKRIIRETYRINKVDLQKQLWDKNIQLSLFLIFIGKSIPDFDYTETKIKLLLQQLNQLNLQTFDKP